MNKKSSPPLPPPPPPPHTVRTMSIQHCAQCNKYLPRWDKHQRCARHCGCTRLLPCPICCDWPEGIWLKLQAWFESHPQPPAVPREGSLTATFLYGMSQGSLSDSVLMAYPQGQASSSSEPEALDLYPSSSDSGAEGSRDWLPRDDPRRIRTATREPKSAVGRAPRKGSTATGPLEPVGSAHGPVSRGPESGKYIGPRPANPSPWLAAPHGWILFRRVPLTRLATPRGPFPRPQLH